MPLNEKLDKNLKLTLAEIFSADLRNIRSYEFILPSVSLKNSLKNTSTAKCSTNCVSLSINLTFSETYTLILSKVLFKRKFNLPRYRKFLQNTYTLLSKPL